MKPNKQNLGTGLKNKIKGYFNLTILNLLQKKLKYLQAGSEYCND